MNAVEAKQTIEDYFASRYCIEAMKQNRTYDGEKIGVVKENFGGEVSSYEAGRVILFRETGDDTVTVETPMTKEEIERTRQSGSLITTIGTTACVPRGLVAELAINA